MRTFSYAVKLSAATHKNLDRFLEQQRILYNAALQERIDCYQKTGKSISRYDQFKSLTKIREADTDFSCFDAASQRSALTKIDFAYKRFFNSGGFPRFRGKGRVRSFDCGSAKRPNFNGTYGFVKIKGIGTFRWQRDQRCSRERVKLVRIVRYPTNVMVQLVCGVDSPIRGNDAVVGIDVGVQERAVVSAGAMISKRTVAASEKKRLQRAVARAKKGSRARRKKVMQLSRHTHREKVRNVHHLHRLTTAIVRNHGTWLAVEDLQIKNMTKHGGAHKTGLNRAILEQNWATFTRQLEDKAERAGGKLVKVNPKNTTQQCSQCGALPREKLTLKDRIYYCHQCGHSEDRDLNAAKNIAQRGHRVLAVGREFTRRAGVMDQ